MVLDRDPNDSTLPTAGHPLTRFPSSIDTLSAGGLLPEIQTDGNLSSKNGGISVPIYHLTNCRESSFPTGDSSHDGSGEKGRRPLHHPLLLRISACTKQGILSIPGHHSSRIRL